MSGGLVSVAIVTFNSARYIRNCLNYVLAQDYQPLEIVVVDNASGDGTREALRQFEGRIHIVRNVENRGFAGGQNQAIQQTRGDWVLALNPDVRLTPDFVTRLVAAGETESTIGTVCGKLLAMGDDFEIPNEAKIDSTGIFFTPSLRHFDRGSKQSDDGRYSNFEYVFGATGAAALYRRKMIEDVAVMGDFFDSDFFAYREDADLAWRAQLFGWTCLYTPRAVAYHVRRVLPSNRRSLPAAINMHSVKNRFLMRINNASGRLYVRHLVPITFRDLIVVAGCLLGEWKSLKAFVFVFRNFRKSWRKRREIRRRRRVDESYIAQWFSPKPVSIPAPAISSGSEAKARVTSH